jgi:hypothetical protein
VRGCRCNRERASPSLQADKRTILELIQKSFEACRAQGCQSVGVVNYGHDCSTLAWSCWRVVVSTTWATAEDVGPNSNGLGEWLYIYHRTRLGWHYAGGEGEGLVFACRKKGMSSGVARDLHIQCV